MPARSVRFTRLAAALFAAAGLLTLAPAGAAAKLRWKPCTSQLGFACSTMRVPLDRSGATPGTVGIQVAREDRKPKGGRVLLALSGGPGQGAVDIGPSYLQSLAPALVHHRLILLDQRGTGGSGVLRCTRAQRARLINPFTATLARQCADELGPKRDFYATADTVADIEAFRQQLGVDKISIQGTSYGTYVAQQYARAYPDHVERLVLDSVVGNDGVDGFLVDSWSAMPRILAEKCAHDACRGITTDPVGDVRELAARMDSGPMSGTYVDDRGRRRRASLGGMGLAYMLEAGDLDPHLRAALPAAVRSGVNGDAAPLLRLVKASIGPRAALREFSYGLNAATTCSDSVLPYPLDSPPADRQASIDDAVAKLPEAALGPFSRALVQRVSVAEQCKLWPPGRAVAPLTSPLPDVPALVLGGRLDMRTPIENAESVAAEMPRAQLVLVPGNGHDQIDLDLSGCVARAMFRFFSNRRLGDACARTSDAVPPARLAPTALDQLPPHRGVPGDRGRILRAAVGAINDVREMYYIEADAQVFDGRGAGLRGGTWRTRGDNGFEFRNVAWSPDVRISGRLTSQVGRWSGRLRVSAPNGLGGRLRFTRRRGVTGVLGGRRVHLPARAVRGANEPALTNFLG